MSTSLSSNRNIVTRDKAPDMPHAKHSFYKMFKRLSHLLLLVIATTLLVYFIVSVQRYQSNWLEQQNQRPGAALAEKFSLVLSATLNHPNIAQNEEQQRVDIILNALISDPAIKSVQVHDFKGNLKYQTGIEAPLTERFLSEQSTARLIRVAPVKRDEQIVGYLTLELDASSLLAQQSALQHSVMQLFVVLLLLGLLVGGYSTRGFYKLRDYLLAKWR